jgi:Surfeit locus protein 6
LIVPDQPHVSDRRDSKVDFAHVTFSNVPGSSGKKAQSFKASSNPSQALEQLVSRKEKLAQLPDDKRKAIEEQEKWNKAEARLEGTKIRDDERRLKNAVKKREKDHSKSKKVWYVRPCGGVCVRH